MLSKIASQRAGRTRRPLCVAARLLLGPEGELVRCCHSMVLWLFPHQFWDDLNAFFCHCKIPNVLDIFDYCRIIFASPALESDDEEMRGGAESDFGLRGRPSVRPQNVLNSFSAFTYFCRNCKEKSLQTFSGQQNEYDNTENILILTTKWKEKFDAFQNNYQIRVPFSVDTVPLKIHFQSCTIFVLLAHDEVTWKLTQIDNWQFSYTECHRL